MNVFKGIRKNIREGGGGGGVEEEGLKRQGEGGRDPSVTG